MSEGDRVAVVIATTKSPVFVTDCYVDPAMTVASVMEVRDGNPTRVNRDEDFSLFVSDVYRALRHHAGRRYPGTNLVLQVDADIEAGRSWQLGAFVSQYLCLEDRLSTDPSTVDRILWCTGTVGRDTGRIGHVDFVREKLERSASFFIGTKRPIEALIPEDDCDDAYGLDLPANVFVRPVESIHDVLATIGTDRKDVSHVLKTSTIPRTRKHRRWRRAAAFLLIVVALAAATQAAPGSFEALRERLMANLDTATEEDASNTDPQAPTTTPSAATADLTIFRREAPSGSNCIGVNTDFGDPVEPLLESLVTEPSGRLQDLIADRDLCGLTFSLKPSSDSGGAYALLALRDSDLQTLFEPAPAELSGRFFLQEEASRTLNLRPRGDLSYEAALVTGAEPITVTIGELESLQDWSAILSELEDHGFEVRRFSQRIERR